MKRSAFRSKGAPPQREATQCTYIPRPRPAAAANEAARPTLHLPRPKENALQHDGYMRLVRMLPCAHCGKAAPSQFCHSDEGKGERIKTDCRRGWPGCADSPGRQGCHSLIGSTGTFKRERRRYLESSYATKTRAAIRAAGTWPATLPAWPGDEGPE